MEIGYISPSTLALRFFSTHLLPAILKKPSREHMSVPLSIPEISMLKLVYGIKIPIKVRPCLLAETRRLDEDRVYKPLSLL
jgi:hypothetical protein